MPNCGEKSPGSVKIFITIELPLAPTSWFSWVPFWLPFLVMLSCISSFLT
jgi:hypothetical protein